MKRTLVAAGIAAAVLAFGACVSDGEVVPVEVEVEAVENGYDVEDAEAYEADE